MLDPNYILEKVEAIAELVKRNESKLYKGKKEVPYHRTYADEVHMANEQKVHALGYFPNELFDRKVPNETDEQRKYRKSSYEPVTMPVWGRALNAVQGRVWNKSNYAVTYGEDYAEYFTKYYPDHKSLVQYFQRVRLPQKMYDANAAMAIEPKYIPMMQNDEGEIVPDDTEMIEPICIIYDAEQVMAKDYDCWVICTHEKSWVYHGNGKEKTGYVFKVFDDTYIYRVVQVGRKKDLDFELVPYYEHGLEYLPIECLKGVPTTDEGYTYYKSYFWPAVGDLNTALYDESTLAISKIANVFPERWEVVPDCDACHGTGTTYNEDGDRVDCDVCHGRGWILRPHPLNAITVTLPDREDERPTAPIPPAGYLEKDPDSPRFLREEVERKKLDSFANLNIDVASKPNGQTATESKIDREELFSMLLTIANEEFKALEWAVDTIGKMRYGGEWDSEANEFSPPQDFTIRSYSEISQEIAEAKKSEMPQTSYRKLLEEYLVTRFNGDGRMRKLIDLAFEADRLSGQSDDLVLRQVMAKTATKREAVIHTSIHTFIDQLVQEDEGFLDKDRAEQIEAINQKADEVVTLLDAASETRNILDEL